LGFCKGAQLFDLDTEEKRSIGRKVFMASKDININEIRQLLYEAVLLDEQDHRRKEKK